LTLIFIVQARLSATCVHPDNPGVHQFPDFRPACGYGYVGGRRSTLNQADTNGRRGLNRGRCEPAPVQIYCVRRAYDEHTRVAECR